MAPPVSYAPALLLAALALAVPGCAAPQGGPPTAQVVGETTAPASRHVVVVSVDGLNSNALTELGRDRAPNLFDLIDHGASTRNARTERERTLTLPNHTGMVTGRRVDAADGGHGVFWNTDRAEPRTVQAAAGEPVRSVFNVVHAAGLTTGLFVSKEKLELFERSWPHAVDRVVLREGNGRLVRRTRADLTEHHRGFTFLHLSKPDVVGHERGFMSPAYLDAVADVDRLIGTLVATIREDTELQGRTTLVVTADHGGLGDGHSDPTRLVNYRVPFVVWGSGVQQGADLYQLNPDYADPEERRTRYSEERQPVRNGDVANLVTDLLGLPAVPGSEHDAGQDLDVS